MLSLWAQKTLIEHYFTVLLLIVSVSGFLREGNVAGKHGEEKLWLELGWVIGMVLGKNRDAVEAEL